MSQAADPHIIVSPASGASLPLLSSSSPPSSPSPGGSPRLSPAASPRRGHRRTPSHVPVYDALTCPDGLSPELFSRIVDKFRELDVRADGHTACDGLVDYDALAACFDEVIGDRLPEEVVERLVENRSRYLAKQVHIYDFLESVVRVHNRHKQYLRGLQDGSSGRLDRQRTHSASAKFSLYRRKTKEILFEDERMLGWHQLNCCGRMLRDFDLWWDRNWRQRRALVPLWKKPFEMIEARFGASTSEYFYFARSILWLNIVLAVLYCFIVVPGIIEFDNEDPDTGEREVSGDEWVGLFIGTGMEKTWMFYDGYKASYGSYKMDLAWILITGIMLFLSLLLTLSFIDKGAQRHTGKLKDVVFSNILFCAVDHRVEDAATLRVQKLRARTALVNRLKMSAEKRLGRLKTAGDRIRHAAGAFLTLLFIGATTSFVAWLVVNEEEKIIPKLERSRTLRYFATMLVPVVVTFFKQASPYVVKAIVNWEGYARARDRFRTIFARSFIVRMFYVMVILFQTIFASDTRFKNEEAVTCNEAYVGIIYYKLLLVDLVVEVGISIFVPWFRLRCSCARLERTPSAHSENDLTRVIRETQDKRKDEFDISESIIDIMYRQALVWAGAPFCPLLPLVAVASGVVHMYIKIWHVVYFSRLSERPLGVSEQNQYIRVVMVITLLVSIVPYTVWLRRVPDCGPHQGKRPIDVFLDDYVQSNETLAVIFAYLSNIVFLWLVILLVFVYTMFLVKQETILESELHHVKKRLKLEVREKQAIIRDNHIQLDEDAERGREAFKDWVEEVGPVAQLYSGAFIDAGLGDLFALIRVEEMAIVELLQSFSATDEHVDLILASIEDKRIEHI